MSIYHKYLPQLKLMPLFQGIDDNYILDLVEAMQPQIVLRKTGMPNPMEGFTGSEFLVCLKNNLSNEVKAKPSKYTMPEMGEPGMMMGEIPGLSLARQRPAEPKPEGAKKPPMPPRPPQPVDQECLIMDGEMIVKFYSAELYPAQAKMIKNFFGILTQKITDIRAAHKAQVDLLNKQIAGEVLYVNTAGCVMKVAHETAAKWNKLHPELPAIVKGGGSVDIVRNALAGKPCDVMIVADEANIADMMMPDHADGYYVFAGNKMVISGKGINSQNWKEKLLDPNATFMHMNPYGDPGGYRAVMAMLLADNVEPGLADKLMNHPGHIGMSKEPPKPGAPRPKADYSFGYYSGPASSGAEFAELPAVMDLSDDALADVYAKVSFAVDDENTIVAKPISHALTIPFEANHKEAAREFIEMFLDNDFEARCYLPKSKAVGNWK